MFIPLESAVGVKFGVTDLVLGLSVQRSVEINDSLPADGEQHLWKLPLQTVLCLTSTPFYLHKHTQYIFSPPCNLYQVKVEKLRKSPLLRVQMQDKTSVQPKKDRLL